MRKETLQVLLSYLTIYVVWGSTYFFISLAVETVPPLLVVGLRFTVGGVLLLGLGLLSGRFRPPWLSRHVALHGSGRRMRAPRPRQVLASMLLGGILLLAGNNLISFAERKVDSYLVALILAAAPLQVAFFDLLLFGRRISLLRLAGIVVGFCGVVVLLYDGRSASASLSPQTVLVLIAGLLWSFGTSLGHRLSLPEDNRINSGIQMLFAGTVSLLIALAAGVQPAAALAQVSLRSLTGVAYLAVVGSLAYSAFTFLIGHEPAVRIVSYSLVNPGIAVLLGLLLGAEEPVPYLALGLPMILVGLAVMLYGEWILERLVRARKSR
jgi:drug/metabolite transporter (DMT)-like permease